MRYPEFVVSSRHTSLGFYMSRLGMKLLRTVNVGKWPKPDDKGDCLG